MLILFHLPNYKFQKLADVWVAHNIDYRKITLSEQPLSAGNFGEVFKGKDVYHVWTDQYYSELSNKHGVFLILFEKIFPTTCLIRTSTFINF